MTTFSDLMWELYRDAKAHVQEYIDAGYDIDVPEPNYTESRARNYEAYMRKINKVYDELREIDKERKEEGLQQLDEDRDVWHKGDSTTEEYEYRQWENSIVHNYLSYIEYYAQFNPKMAYVFGIIQGTPDAYYPAIVDGYTNGDLPEMRYRGSYEYAGEMATEIEEFLLTWDSHYNPYVDEGYADDEAEMR